MIYSFGEFEFDDERWELYRAGASLHVPLKVMQLLAVLLGNRERVVSNAELLAELWPGVVVTDASVTKAIRILRRVLGDDGEAQHLIRTIRGRGYRLIAKVIERREREAAREVTSQKQRSALLHGNESFVSREAELAELRAGVERAFEGRSSVFFVAGDPGIGKTRLLEAFFASAIERGARVSWGRSCEEGGAPELWPWIQILRSLRDMGALVESDPTFREISRIFPLAEAPNDLGLDSVAEASDKLQFRVFDAIARCLRLSAESSPLVLLVEDLHSADLASLRLIRFLCREQRGARLMMVGSFRPLATARTEGASKLLYEIVREARLLSLAGLDELATRRLLETELGELVSTELASRAHQISEGNPFFLSEIVRLIHAAGSASAFLGGAVPTGIREAIKSRISSVPPNTRELLAAASVIGRDFELALLHEIGKLSAIELAERLEPALEHKIVAPLEGELGRYRFTHILLRDICYELTDGTRRADLHRRIGEALELFSLPGSEPPAALLAHHFLHAALGMGSEKAASYSLEAGRHALCSLAFDEAKEHCENAISAVRFELAQRELYADALTTLGQALRLLGDHARAREVFSQSLALARALEDPLRAARAAYGYAQASPESGRANPAVISVLEEAVRLLEAAPEPHPAELRDSLALILARLSISVVVAGRSDQGESLSDRALELARSTKNPATLVQALLSRHTVLWHPGTAKERLSIAREIILLERSLTGAQPVTEARMGQITDLLELGDQSALGRALEAYAEHAEQARDPFGTWNVRIFETTRAMLEGRFHEAEQLSQQAFEIGRRLDEKAARRYAAAELWWIRLEQGRALEIEALTREAVERRPEGRGDRAALLRLYAEASLLEPARQELEILCPGDEPELALDWLTLPTLASLAVAVHALGDLRRAAGVRTMLLPYAAEHVVLGAGVVQLGAVSYYAALCERTLSNFDACIEQLERALSQTERISAWPHVARTRFQLAEALAATRRPADRARALECAKQSLTDSTEMEMQSVMTRARKLCAELERR